MVFVEAVNVYHHTPKFTIFQRIDQLVTWLVELKALKKTSVLPRSLNFLAIVILHP